MGGQQTIEETRRLRLQELCDQLGSQAALARAIGCDKRQVSFWLASPERPGSKNISSRTARVAETKLGKNHGWIDGVDPDNGVKTGTMRATMELLAAVSRVHESGTDLTANPDAIAVVYNHLARYNG